MPLAKTARRNLIQIADAYAKATRVSRSHVSKAFYGRSNFLDEFARGTQTLSVDKLDEMVEAFRKQWPEGADYPLLPAIRM
jgi:hypothetical protein